MLVLITYDVNTEDAAGRKRLRQIIGHLVVDSQDPALGKHLAKARAQGFRLNVNLLGEAVLGDQPRGGVGDLGAPLGSVAVVGRSGHWGRWRVRGGCAGGSTRRRGYNSP